MKKICISYLLPIFFVLIAYLGYGQRFWVAAGAANWNNTVNWSTTSGGAGGASVPGPSDVVTFNANGLGNCTLDIAPTIAGITVNGYTGTININGFNLTTTGDNTLTTGSITNGGGAAAFTLNTTGNTTFNGTTMGANVNGLTGRLFFNGSVFSGTVNVTKTDNNNDDGRGGNVFNGVTTITNTGTGYLLMGDVNRDQFNAAVTFNNNSDNRINLANNHGGQTTTFASDVTLNSNKIGATDIWSYRIAEGINTAVSFGGNLTINCAGSFQSNLRILQGAGSTATYAGTVTINSTNTNTNTFIAMGTNGISTYNGNIVVTNSGGSSGIQFNTGVTASSTLATGRTISIGGTGFSSGSLDLARFSQNGSTNQFLNTFSGTASLSLGPNTRFDGNVNFVAPRLFLQGGTFNGVAYLEKNGASNDDGRGGNVFNGVTTITNTGAGYLLTGDVNRDQFNAAVTFNNNSDNRIYFAYNHGGQTTTFASDVTLNSNKIGATDAWSYRIAEGINTAVTFGGNLTINCAGSFQSNLRILQGAGSTATYTGTVTINSTNTNVNTSIAMGTNGISTYNGNIVVTNSGGSVDIQFNTGTTASSTLATGRTISIGGAGFSSGSLNLARFSQNGSTNQFLNTFSGTASLSLGPNTRFDGNVNFVAPRLFLQGGTFNGVAYLEKNGASNDGSAGNTTFGTAATIVNNGLGFLRTNGGNVFNGPTSLIDTGSSYLLLEFTTGNTYNGDLSITNSGTSNVRMAFNGNTLFNGNIQVNSTAGLGVYFGETATATSVLANTHTLSAGGTGFNNGQLLLQRFTQTGTTAQNIVLTGAATFNAGPANVWNGALTVSSPLLFLNGNTFNGTTNSFTKTGTTTDGSTGGNIFSTGTTTTIINSGTGVLSLANGAADDFAGHIIFNQANGTIQPAYNVASTFRGNVTVNGAATIIFGANTGAITFSGGNAQSVIKTGAASPTFRRMVMNKSANRVTLSTDATVTTNANFTAGIMNTTSTNYLNFADDATSTGGSSASHVDGPIRKTGNDAFTFPTGDNGVFMSIGISAPGNVAHFFTAEYNKAAQSFGGSSTYAAGIITVSSCDYWTLDRNPAVGGSDVNVTLNWNSPDCTAPYISNLADLRVVRWNGTQWVDHGNGLTTGNTTTGSVTTSAPVTSFSPFTLGSNSLNNPLPVELISFTALLLDDKVELNWSTASELNNDFFEVQRSIDGIEFTRIAKIDGAGTSHTLLEYQHIDQSPLSNKSYYRLKQTDFDGQASFSRVVAVDRGDFPLTIHPNPVNRGTFVKVNSTSDFIVTNTMGVIVLRITNTNEIDVSVLAPGIYTVMSATGKLQRLVVL